MLMTKLATIRRAIGRYRLRVVSVDVTEDGDTLLTLARKGSGERGGRYKSLRQAVLNSQGFSSLYGEGLLVEHPAAVWKGTIKPDAKV